LIDKYGRKVLIIAGIAIILTMLGLVEKDFGWNQIVSEFFNNDLGHIIWGFVFYSLLAIIVLTIGLMAAGFIVAVLLGLASLIPIAKPKPSENLQKYFIAEQEFKEYIGKEKARLEAQREMNKGTFLSAGSSENQIPNLYWQQTMRNQREQRMQLARKQTEYANEVVKFDREKRMKKDFWLSFIGKGIPFENEIARLYTDLGYKVIKTKASDDEGIDLILSKGNEKILVQCKAYDKPLSPSAVREFYGAFRSTSEKGILVTIHGVSKSAFEWSRNKNIEFVSLSKLLELQNSIDGR